jgi:cytochrome c oxidase cbb3-type subunit 3
MLTICMVVPSPPKFGKVPRLMRSAPRSSPSPHPLGRLRFVVAALALAALVACQRAPDADALPEWTPKDHASKDDTTRLATGEQTAPVGRDAAAASAAQTLLDVAWRNQCATCHGLMGRGDGPQGPMFKATDLTSPEWQAKASDDDIRAAIKNGKGKMPKFDLPDDVVAAMIVRIRSLKGR